MRFDTLDQVVKDICEIGGGDMQHKNYGTVLKICVRTLQDLNLFTQIPNYKTVELEVRGNLTAKMPDDVLRPLKIGKLENGRIFEIRYAQDIVIPKNALTECCECEEEVKVYETVEAGSEGGGTGLCDYTINLESPLTEGQTLWVQINNVFVDVTDEVVDGDTWIRLQSSDVIGAYEVRNDGGKCCDYSVEGIELRTGVCITIPEVINVDDWGDTSEFSIGFQFGDESQTTWFVNFSEPFEQITSAEIIAALELAYGEQQQIVFTYEVNGNTICIYPNIDYVGVCFVAEAGFLNNGGVASTAITDTNLCSDFVINGQYENTDELCANAIENTCIANDHAENGLFVGLLTFQVLINDVWTDVTDEVENGTWSRTNVCDDVITEWRIIDSEDNIIDSGDVTADCDLPYSEQGFADADCDDAPIPPVSYQRLKSIEKVKPKCDTKGCCNTCKKPQRNNNVLSQQTLPDARLIPDVIFGGNLAANIDAFFNYNNIRSSQFYVERFGQQPNPPKLGWFNYDLVNGIIKLDGNWSEGDCLLFMYRTEMQELDGTKVIPVECFNMLLYKCKEMLWTRNRPDQMNQRQLFEDEYKRIKRLYNKMTIQEWEDAISGYKYSSVKR